MMIWQKLAGWPARLALLAALAAGGTGLYAWASESEAAPAPHAAALEASTIAPENMPLTTCPLGCDGSH